jgi:hypothetical protein
VIDWARWRACPVCFAELGQPCLTLSGFTAAGPVSVAAERPHGGRKERTAPKLPVGRRDLASGGLRGTTQNGDS